MRLIASLGSNALGLFGEPIIHIVALSKIQLTYWGPGTFVLLCAGSWRRMSQRGHAHKSLLCFNSGRDWTGLTADDMYPITAVA